METVKKVEINGKTYVRKADVQQSAEKRDGMEYVIIRTYSAGVFAGYLKWRDGKDVKLLQARRLWHWDGAATLSQLAVDGTSKPDECKFPCEVAAVTLTEVIEILPVTALAKSSIQEVATWTQ